MFISPHKKVFVSHAHKRWTVGEGKAPQLRGQHISGKGEAPQPPTRTRGEGSALNILVVLYYIDIKKLYLKPTLLHNKTSTRAPPCFNWPPSLVQTGWRQHQNMTFPNNPSTTESQPNKQTNTRPKYGPWAYRLNRCTYFISLRSQEHYPSILDQMAILS